METLVIVQGIAIIFLVVWCAWMTHEIAYLISVIVGIIEKLGWSDGKGEEK